MGGVALFPILYERAKKNGCYIEAIIIKTASVDAMLRIGMVLSEQIAGRHTIVNERLLHQPDGERNFNERQIYCMALEHGVIDNSLFERLETSYLERNKAVHRLYLTELKYAELRELLAPLEALAIECTDVVRRLESRQLELGVGMVRPLSDPVSEVNKYTTERIEELVKKRLR